MGRVGSTGREEVPRKEVLWETLRILINVLPFTTCQPRSFKPGIRFQRGNGACWEKYLFALGQSPEEEENLLNSCQLGQCGL